MRFINQARNNLSNNNGSSSTNNTTCNSSDISDSIESIVEPTNSKHISSTSENFNNWNTSKNHARNHLDGGNGLMRLNKKAFTVLCEPESENNENRDLHEVPNSR